jgi:hypothetical protein
MKRNVGAVHVSYDLTLASVGRFPKISGREGRLVGDASR